VSYETHLKLSQRHKRQIEAHGKETYPHECCGALIGRTSPLQKRDTAQRNGEVEDREVIELMPLANRRDDSPRNRFEVTADDVRLAEKTAREKKLELIGWYHSHPDHPAKPSEFDREHAWPWYSYIIVSVQKGEPKDMTSWRLRDDRSDFDPEEIDPTLETDKSYRFRLG
jgi:proteasome lid subunit RPN8/RPN11